MELSYILNELGEDRELYFNAVAPPIIQTWEMTMVGLVHAGSTVHAGAGRLRARRARFTRPSLGLRIQTQR